MLKVEDLHVCIDNKKVLQGIDLCVAPGEVHAIMGPNGSGKSTFVQVLAGKPGYTVTQGRVDFRGEDVLAMQADERARTGMFLGFQYPVEIPGVNNAYFLKAALNAQRKHADLPELDAMDFLALIKEKMALLDMDPQFTQRPVNQGFSGGEKKRNEVLQMAVLQPHLAMLDEIDSGLDIDALRLVAQGINALRSTERSLVLVTHYPRLLQAVQPDHVHVLSGGRIVRSGGKDLALKLEAEGYGWLQNQTPPGMSAGSRMAQ